MKQRSPNTNRLLEICPGLDNHLSEFYDDMLWKLMQNAANSTHLSLEPWWSTLNPSLPNFCPLEEDDAVDLYEHRDGSYIKTPRKSELREEKMKEGVMSKLMNWFQSSIIDNKKAKGKIKCSCHFMVNAATSHCA